MFIKITNSELIDGLIEIFIASFSQKSLYLEPYKYLTPRQL